MVGIGVMGLGEVEGSELGVVEVRAVSGQDRRDFGLRYYVTDL